LTDFSVPARLEFKGEIIKICSFSIENEAFLFTKLYVFALILELAKEAPMVIRTFWPEML